MPKSVGDYYSERMKQLLENQKKNKESALSAPSRTSRGNSEDEKSPSRRKYDSFAPGETKPRYKKPNVTYTEEKPRKKPEQTVRDTGMEDEKREEAARTAKRGKKLRRIRDSFISIVLILSVAAVIALMIYRILFVVSDIEISGNSYYSAEEIINASGIAKGDRLYSFRNSQASRAIILGCPLIKSVDIDKNAPSGIKITVEEETPYYYASFYGEYRELTEDIRVLYSTTVEKAKEESLILLKLPAASDVLSGDRPVFSGVRNDTYIYEVSKEIMKSELADRVVSIDLRDKYTIKINCENKYSIILGDTESVEKKLKMAAEILKDETFENDITASIDVSDPTAAGVIPDAYVEKE